MYKHTYRHTYRHTDTHTHTHTHTHIQTHTYRHTHTYTHTHTQTHPSLCSLDQHTRPGDPLPGVELIEDITIYKGGTSVMADAYMGHAPAVEPSHEAFAFGFGVALQFVDDLQVSVIVVAWLVVVGGGWWWLVVVSLLSVA